MRRVNGTKNHVGKNKRTRRHTKKFTSLSISWRHSKFLSSTRGTLSLCNYNRAWSKIPKWWTLWLFWSLALNTCRAHQDGGNKHFVPLFVFFLSSSAHKSHLASTVLCQTLCRLSRWDTFCVITGNGRGFRENSDIKICVLIFLQMLSVTFHHQTIIDIFW